MPWNPPDFSPVAYPDVLTHKRGEAGAFYLSFELDLASDFVDKTLEMLMLTGQKAAFVVRGGQIEANSQRVLRIYHEGHELVNGFSSVEKPAYLSPAEIRRGILETDEKIATVTGYSPVFFRPPEGAFDGVLLDILARTGHEMVLWNTSPPDRAYGNPTDAAADLLLHLRPGDIIRLSDRTRNLSLSDFLGDFLMSAVQAGHRFAAFRDILDRV